jgi:hypothetical protein
MYLLDTDTVIFSLKGHPEVRRNLRIHLRDPLRIDLRPPHCLLYVPQLTPVKLLLSEGKDKNLKEARGLGIIPNN